MYGVSTANISRNGGSTLKRDFFKEDYVDAAVHQVSIGIAALAENAGAFIYCGHRQFGDIERRLMGNGFRTGPFAWCKTDPAPSVRKSIWRSAIELAVWGVRGDGFYWRTQSMALNFWIGGCCKNGHPEKCGHPTQKPVGSVSAAIQQMTKEGECVLDTSMGSGTTLLAAKVAGRRAIGIDISEEYCEMAANRLIQGVLFGVPA